MANEMHHGNSIPPPSNVAEVEELVKRLYTPGHPLVITQINEQLQQLQLSEHGWKLADELLASDDPNVQFFAAITFMVKLNKEGPSLDDENALNVQLRLISWLIHFANRGGAELVCKKLCSTLTTYFIRSPLLWEQPLLQIALSLHHGHAVTSTDTRNSASSMIDLLRTLNPPQLTALLWFAATLAEEVIRVDNSIPAQARCHNEMERSVKDARTLISWSFAFATKTTGPSPRAGALPCFLAWITYAQTFWQRKPETMQCLRELIGQAMECLLDDALFEDALEIFLDMLESYSNIFQPRHLELLAKIVHDNIQPKLESALTGVDQDHDPVTLGQFIVAFGCANIEQVVEQPGDVLGSQAILKLQLQIISEPGYPGDEDHLSIQSVEFWNTYIEYINDTTFSRADDDPEPDWLPQAKLVMQKVVGQLWKKMWTPPHDVAIAWGEEQSEGFKEFRLDASDLMLSIFVLLGETMLQQLVKLSMWSLGAREWHAVEAALFCLKNLADNVLEDTSNEHVIGEVFRSSLFREMSDFSQSIPSQTHRTAMDTLGSYSQYVERHTEFLPDTLRYLFASLETPGLVVAAAKSIVSLCSTCRASLTGELEGFLGQYQRFLGSDTCDPFTKVKVIGAIASIIQARTPESAKALPLLALLENVEKDVADAKQFAAAGDHDMAESTGVAALECLASIGKGMQEPDDVPIDLENDDKNGSTKPNFWESEEGRAVQQRIVGCFSVLEVVGNNSAAIDATCQVLKSGFTETEPGPFVLPTEVTVRFVQQCDLRTPQLESVLATATVLITQHSRPTSKRIQSDVSAIYARVADFMKTLGQSSNDPELAEACLDVLRGLMPYYTHVLFESIDESMLDFTFSAVEGAESHPKRSACHFWTKLIKPQTAAISTETKERIDQVMAVYGPKLANSLMSQVGGNALRSELDPLCDLLKVLLLHQGHTLLWLRHGLTSDTFPGSNVAVDDRERFLRQLSAARSDGTKIKELTRIFWAACRGTVVSYG